jgi:hypothetical protein
MNIRRIQHSYVKYRCQAEPHLIFRQAFFRPIYVISINRANRVQYYSCAVQLYLAAFLASAGQAQLRRRGVLYV